MLSQTLLYCILSSPLLNPHALPLPREISDPVQLIPEALQNEWLDKLTSRLEIYFPISRDNLRDHEGESLSQKIKDIRQYFLELKFTEAHSLLEEAIGLLNTALPYEKMSADYAELASLALILEDSNPALTSPLQAEYFQDDPNFLKHLPSRLKGGLTKSHSEPKILNAKDLSTQKSSALVFGTPFFFPIKIRAKHFILHIWTQDELEAYQIDWDGVRFSKKKIWSRPLWNLFPESVLSQAAFLSKPSVLKSRDLWVLFEESESKSKLKKLNLGKRPSPLANQTHSPELRPKDQTAELKDEDSSFWKSPWFWIVTGVVAGLGGYFIYESTQTTTVRTP